MDPLTHLKSAKSRDGDARDHHEEDGKRRRMILGKSCCGGANEVGKLARCGIEDGRSDGNPIHPQIPGRQKTAQVTVRTMGPDVETAFQWPDPVEANNRGGHRKVEDDHGGDPSESLGAAKARGDPHPRAANDAEDLRQNQVAESQPAKKMVFIYRGRSDLAIGRNGCTVAT
jgi:hypothetical protein